jgi:hypothetical protein
MSGIVERPTFSYNNDNTKPIRAGGVILYKRTNNNNIEVLLIKKIIDNTCRYEDIGGKTDSSDINIFDTISRETEEETNNVINKNIIKTQLINSNLIYSYKSKYVVAFTKANKYERKLNTDLFGTEETHDKIIRTIHWVNINNILENKICLHPRLKMMLSDLKNQLNSLKINKIIIV